MTKRKMVDNLSSQMYETERQYRWPSLEVQECSLVYYISYGSSDWNFCLHMR